MTSRPSSEGRTRAGRAPRACETALLVAVMREGRSRAIVGPVGTCLKKGWLRAVTKGKAEYLVTEEGIAALAQVSRFTGSVSGDTRTS